MGGLSPCLRTLAYGCLCFPSWRAGPSCCPSDPGGGLRPCSEEESWGQTLKAERPPQLCSSSHCLEPWSPVDGRLIDTAPDAVPTLRAALDRILVSSSVGCLGMPHQSWPLTASAPAEGHPTKVGPLVLLRLVRDAPPKLATDYFCTW